MTTYYLTSVILTERGGSATVTNVPTIHIGYVLQYEKNYIKITSIQKNGLTNTIHFSCIKYTAPLSSRQGDAYLIKTNDWTMV